MSMPRNVSPLPIRLRPWFLLFTTIFMVILALLGFTNAHHSVPVNDKVLHFFCFGFATGVFYFIFDVEEDARRIWFWRYSGLILTAVICFFFGGIVSEFVQAMLPYKTFDFWDIVANLFGSGLGLYISYHIERYYRRRREIARLYKPLSGDMEAYASEDEDGNSTPPRPAPPLLQQQAHSPGGQQPTADTTIKSTTGIGKMPAFKNVWDDRVENVFDVGDEDSEEDAWPTSGSKGK